MSMPMRWDHAVAPEPPVPSRVPLRNRRTGKNRRMARLLLAMTLCAMVGGVVVVSAQMLFRTLQPVPGLRLLKNSGYSTSFQMNSAEAERNVGFVSVTGTLMNRSGTTLSDVEAVVELLDAQNKPLRVESALLSLDSVPAGSSSPFRVEMIDDARAVAYRVHFKRLFGSSLY